MKALIYLLLLCTACSRSKTDLASLIDQGSLIASIDTIPITEKDRLNRDDIDRLYRFYPKTLEKIQSLKKLSAQDIKNLTRAGIGDDVILYEITRTRSRFYLTPEDEVELHQAGVSERVVAAMKDTIDDRY